MRVFRRGNRWGVDYLSKGIRIRDMVSDSKEGAEKVLADLVASGKVDNAGMRKVPHRSVIKPRQRQDKQQTGLLFENLCDMYLKDSKATNKFQSYRRNKVSIQNLLEAFAGRGIGEISVLDVEQYKNSRQEKVTPATVNRELTCMKHMFNKAVDWELITENRLRRVKNFKEPPGRVRFLDDDKERDLIVNSAPHLKPIVIFALNMGLRKGEILNLKWSDIKMENEEIMVPQPKTNTIKIAPMNQTVLDVIKQLPRNGHEYVFCHPDGQPYRDVKRSFHTACKRAGIKNFRFHDCRHHFASKLVMSGESLRAVQILLGHKDISTTMRYSHISDVYLHEAVRKLDRKKGKKSRVGKDDRNEQKNNKGSD
jgi:site-specific recombinase XerD